MPGDVESRDNSKLKKRSMAEPKSVCVCGSETKIRDFSFASIKYAAAKKVVIQTS